MAYFLSLHSLNDELEQVLELDELELFVLHYRGRSFFYFGENVPSITFN